MMSNNVIDLPFMRGESLVTWGMSLGSVEQGRDVATSIPSSHSEAVNNSPGRRQWSLAQWDTLRGIDRLERDPKTQP